MRFIQKVSFYFTLLSIFAFACSKKGEDCGCDGSTSRILENRKARYIGDGTFVVPDSISIFISVRACVVDTVWEISKNENNWNYTISGDIKNTCLGPNPELRLRAPGGPIQITFIKKN
ncbi:hypothetical protein LZG74_16450 [Dyadobacter sp. CY327]|uniref:hypothetical protein n=1 Tax=Dyadobacter sp. CY327 TaxID=2907301 RepID=UPI001F350593|nr:hypothetical protein [Dyadobacter sp. CY327]MCE7071911.1 hypothetical protein [Dyadobacter sp. CY327]